MLSKPQRCQREGPRLAVDRRQQGKGYGRFLLADALYRAARSEIASFAVIVDAKDESASAFYRRYGFVSYASNPLILFLPLSTAVRLIEQTEPRA